MTEPKKEKWEVIARNPPILALGNKRRIPLGSAGLGPGSRTFTEYSADGPMNPAQAIVEKPRPRS